MTPALDDLGDLFAALADSRRRILLERLALAGESTATALAAELPISRQAVVKHLALLDRALLVQARRQGREVRYRVRLDRLTTAARRLEAIAAGWEETLAEIKRIAELPEEAISTSPQPRGDA